MSAAPEDVDAPSAEHSCGGSAGRASCTRCMALEVELWDTINRYAVSVGGDPSQHVYGNGPRMQAVADVSLAVAARVADFASTEFALTRSKIDDLAADHKHLRRLYTESRDYVRALERERDDLVDAAKRHVAEANALDAQIEVAEQLAKAWRDERRAPTELLDRLEALLLAPAEEPAP